MALPMSQPLPGGGQFLQTPRFTPEQSQVLQNLLQLGSQNFNPEVQEQRARKQFYGETIPGLAERFTAMGGGQRSSAFQGALGQAGSDLESQLAAQRGQYGLQALQMGLQPQNEQFLQPSEYQGLLGGLGVATPQLAELGGKGLGYLLGGQGGQSQQRPGSTMANALTTALPAATTAATGLGLGAKLAGLGAAAAPLGLPLAAGAGIVGLPLLLSYLLGD